MNSSLASGFSLIPNVCVSIELYLGMKKAVYRPANYRKNTLTKNTATSAQDELLKSLKRKTESAANGHKNPYASSRPWLK